MPLNSRLYTKGGRVVVTQASQVVTWAQPVRDWMLYNNGNKNAYIQLDGASAQADPANYYLLEPGEKIGSSMWSSATIWLTRFAVVCGVGDTTTLKYIGIGGN